MKKIIKWLKGLIPVLLIIGWVTAREFSYGWHYFIIVTIGMLIIYHKGIWENTKALSHVMKWKLEEKMDKEEDNEMEEREGRSNGDSL